jgi:hypothetical protein
MERDAVFVRLAALLAERVRSQFKAATSPAAVAETLARIGIDGNAARSLAWGQDVELTPKDSEALACGLALHKELLDCVLLSVSDEILEHTLLRAQADFCPASECGYCEMLTNQIAWMLDGSSFDPDEPASEIDWVAIALDALEHLSKPLSAPAPAAPASKAVVGLISEARIAELVAVLPEASKLRVLQFALSELAIVTDGRPIGDFQAIGRLRDVYLTQLGREAFDQLATAPEGELESDELAHLLNLPHRRALGQLLRSVNAAVSQAAIDGFAISEQPLEIRNPRVGERRFRLSPRTLAAWRALLKGEAEAVSLASEDATADSSSC